jgi:hypothetical protein
MDDDEDNNVPTRARNPTGNEPPAVVCFLFPLAFPFPSSSLSPLIGSLIYSMGKCFRKIKNLKL